MPLYEYLCGTCGHRFERIQKFSDPPITECPKCGEHVDKQFSSPAIQFKGSGWYVNDYARAGKSDGKSETSTKAGSSSSEAKSDKPASESKAEQPAAPAAPKPATSSDKT